jgi:casein kinase II subunit beta
MYTQYASKEFGTCPLIQCNGQPVLPVGLRDEIGIDTAKVFCPKCKNVYQPPHSSLSSSSRGGGGGHHISSGGGAVDGAAFGTTFPHLFLMTFNNLVPDPHPVDSIYIPRVFGFRVHRTAHRGSGGVAVSGGGGVVTTAGGNNGRKVVGVGGGAQRNMTTSTRTASTGVPPVQEITNGSMKVEVKVGEDGQGEDEAKAEAAEEQTSIIKVDDKKTDDGNTEVVATVEGKECAIDETITAATNKREKGDTSDRSSSNTSKRQRRSVEAVN